MHGKWVRLKNSLNWGMAGGEDFFYTYFPCVISSRGMNSQKSDEKETLLVRHCSLPHSSMNLQNIVNKLTPGLRNTLVLSTQINSKLEKVGNINTFRAMKMT